MSIVYNSFPSAMATCMILLSGQLGSVFGSHFVGTLLNDNCTAIYYVNFIQIMSMHQALSFQLIYFYDFFLSFLRCLSPPRLYVDILFTWENMPFRYINSYVYVLCIYRIKFEIIFIELKWYIFSNYVRASECLRVCIYVWNSCCGHRHFN